MPPPVREPARPIEVEVVPPAALPVDATPFDRWLRILAFIMDDLFQVPGTKRRVGLDPLIGLIPGIGDGANGALSAVTILRAAQRGVPKIVLGRMALNILLDSGFGAVPVIGDAFSFWFKSFQRNYALLVQHSEDHPKAPSTADKVFVWGFVALAIAIPIGATFLLAALWYQLFKMLFG